MAKKKIPSIDDALKTFKEVMKRASLSNYHYVDGILLSRLSKNNRVISILVVPDEELWLRIINDEELKPNIKELDIAIPEEYVLKDIFQYGKDLNSNSWINLDSEEIQKGKVISISVRDGWDYEIPINKDQLPVKLKKAEFNNIKYKVIDNINLVLLLQKRFDSPVGVEAGGFSMLRVFRII